MISSYMIARLEYVKRHREPYSRFDGSFRACVRRGWIVRIVGRGTWKLTPAGRAVLAAYNLGYDAGVRVCG